ncbi:uncharacterized protein LOC126827820 [Patella vulgata]|uniref:uncharacterized protein LOC126827820 n=1 Tax=Patella vulgata TaxID=6465 RepID=UPI0021805C78|nr:uncharacterized protein LOC126827820 [Patella vulgata]XP_050413343.1 uncharacterized protein LOC126827820 [Patella vulgata]
MAYCYKYRINGEGDGWNGGGGGCGGCGSGGAWDEPDGAVDDTDENVEEEPPEDDRDSGTTEEMERLDQNLIEDNELHHANTFEEKPKKYFGGLGYLLTRFKSTDNQNIPLIPKERTKKCFCGRSLAFLVIVSGFLFGYDTGVVSGSMLLIRPYFKLNVIWTQAIVSATVATGAAVAGLAEFVADIVGRKIIILLGAIIFTSGAVIMGIADSTIMVISGRIVVGLAMGLSTVVVRLYVKESAHISNKKWLISMLNMFFTVGNLVANFLCMVLSYIGIYVGDDTMWKYVLGFGLVPAVLQFIAMFILPESPRWLMEEDDPEQARENLITLRGTDEIEAELNQMRLDVEQEKREAEKDSSDDDDSPWGVFEDVIDELDDDVEDTFDTQNENRPNQTNNDNSTSPVGNRGGASDGKSGTGNDENPNRNEGELKSGNGDESAQNGTSNNSITGKHNSSSGNSYQSGNNPDVAKDKNTSGASPEGSPGATSDQPGNISDNSSSTGSNNPSGTGTDNGTGDGSQNNGTNSSAGQDNGRNSTDPLGTGGGSNNHSNTRKDNGDSTGAGANSSAKQGSDGNSTGSQGTSDGSDTHNSTERDNGNGTNAKGENGLSNSSAKQSNSSNGTNPHDTSDSPGSKNHSGNGKNNGNSTGSNGKNNATNSSAEQGTDNKSTGPQDTGDSPNSIGSGNHSGTGNENGNSTGAKGNNGSGTNNQSGSGPDGQSNTRDGTGSTNSPSNGAKNGKHNPGKPNSNNGKKKSNPNSKGGKSSVGANKSEYTPLEGSAKPAPGRPVIVRIWNKPKVRRPFLNVLFLFLFQQLSGISVLILYGGSIIFLAGMSTTMSLGLLNLPNGLYVIATYISTKKDTLEDNRKLLLMVSFFGVFMGMCFIATGFQLQESYITPVNYIEDLSNVQLNVSVYPYCNHSYYSSCELCVRNGYCGFCHPVGDWLNGSCLPMQVNNTQRSVVGRCNISHYPGAEYEFVDASGGCHNFSWFVVVGMVVFVLFYAPGLGQVTHSEDSERCPVWARKTSNSISRSVNWVANLLISMSFLLLVEGITTYGTFWMFSGFCLFAFVYVTKYLADDD